MRLWAAYPKIKSFYKKVPSALELSEYGGWRQERTITSQIVFQNLVLKVSSVSAYLVTILFMILNNPLQDQAKLGTNMMFDGTHTLYLAALSLIRPSFQVVKYRTGPLTDCSSLAHN